ncbi:diguanylate cyclase domain-containing protein [Gilvimarinus sp. 1_MG-2023]|uniref:diguanylate cyclase domain-containing protein n=1 Tax=Gilvimarinus sp. 1_MG-2023 TaxID=3062638 RepID=UPI0026E3DB34|nr:diguanylate cyclase [Gilvimarinus sp. 1_MG-2023]MDO6748448.1 diguanylate cyclase [Gilvimarinus sp. 1_MG-2023]
MSQQDLNNSTLAMFSILVMLALAFTWSGLGMMTGVIEPVANIVWAELISDILATLATFALLAISAFLPIRRHLAVAMVCASSLLFLGAWHGLTLSLVSHLPRAMTIIGALTYPAGMIILAASVFHFGRAYRLSRLLLGSYRKIEYSLATQDQLTQLFNRRYFYTSGPELLQSCQKHQQPCVLIIMTIQNLPDINQAHGVSAGDAVLSEMGNLLYQSTRRVDLAARLSGRRIAIFLPDTPQANADDIAGRVLGLCQKLTITKGNGERIEVALTIDQCVVLAGDHEAWEDLVERCLS